MSSQDDGVDAVARFFDRYRVASLRLPADWFGRPFDNWHQLTSVTMDGDELVITIDQLQVLRLHATSHATYSHILRIGIQDGSWEWTSYGGSDRHHEQLAGGSVEFHAVPSS